MSRDFIKKFAAASVQFLPAVGAVGGPETSGGQRAPTVGTAHLDKGIEYSSKGNATGQDGERVEGLHTEADAGDREKNGSQKDNAEADKAIEIWIVHCDPPQE